MTNPPADDAEKDAEARRPDTAKSDAIEEQKTPPPVAPVVPPAPQAGPPPERFWAKNGVALAGIAATVITAVSVSFFGYQTSIETQEAERQQSSLEFQRTERKTAYSEFLTKVLVLEDVENKVDTTRYSRPLQPDQRSIDELKESQAESDGWQAAKDQLVIAAAAVDLVGSGNVQFRALDLRDIHNEVENAYFDLSHAYMSLPPNQQAVDAAVKLFESKRSDAAKARFEFSQAASESLGISLLGP